MATTEAPRIDKAWIARQLQTNLARMLSPGVCAKVLASLKRGPEGFGEVADALSADPYITAKVVGMANLVTRQGQSPGVPVTSIERAVQVLGLRHVELLVLSVMLTGPLMANDPHVPRRLDLWKWVISCGVAGEHIGRGLAPRDKHDELSVGSEHLVHGLVLGLGTLIMNAGLGRAYEESLGASLRPLSLASRERKRFGADHYQVTQWALELMRCPADVCPYAGALAEGGDSPMALRGRTVEALGALVAASESARAAAFLADAMPRLGMDPTGLLDEEATLLRARARELCGVFQLDLGDWREQNEQRQQALLDAGSAIESLVIDRLTMLDAIDSTMKQGVQASHAAEAAMEVALTDALTGLLNRRGWDERLRELTTLTSGDVGLLLIDLDRFKQINDTFGHIAGDEALAALGKVVASAGPPPILAARLGGDEFAAVFPTPMHEQLETLAQQISARFRAQAAPARTAASVSIGGLIVPAGVLAARWDEAYRRADASLYEAKGRGRNCAVIV